jgi:Na+/H+ antiporter NhaC
MKLTISALLLFTTVFLPLWSPGLVVFWPSIIALALAFTFRRPALALATGALVGVIYLNLDTPELILTELAGTHFLQKVASPWNISILFFTLIFGGFAGIMQYGGGLTALAEKMLSKKGNTQRAVEQSAFMLGLICFFDGLANSMLVGRLFRPLVERFNLSKARLAYIVDSTSSPIACLSIASTWIAYQLAMIRDGVDAVHASFSPYGLYLQSWPTNFYCLFSLILLFTSIRHSWSIGPMKSYPNHSSDSVTASSSPEYQPVSAQRSSPAIKAAVSSLLVLLTTLLGGLFFDGWLRSPAGTPAFEMIAKAEASTVLFIVSILSAAFAYLIHLILRPDSIPPDEYAGSLEHSFWEGSSQMMRPLAVLLAAWALSSTLKELNTAAEISMLLDTNLAPAFLPVSIFIGGSIISFFTGTSWGTMGILTPLAIPIAIGMSPDPATDPALLTSVIGAIFSGAVFGDHCSPLSDTTIVSSVACGIDPVDHVRTQLPYALIAGGWACLFGFLPTGFGGNPWLCLIPAGIALFFLPHITARFSRH